MFRILHLSDLHYKDEMQQQRVIEALVVDIKKERNARPFNAVVFSGDMAAKGDTTATTVESILSKFVSKIKDAVGQEVALIICPGNHDINLKQRDDLFTPIFDGIDSPEKANKLVQKAGTPQAANVWSHIDGFRNLARAIDEDAFTKNPLFYTKIIESNNISVGFACLNSAWLTRGGGRADYGNLYVGEHLLDLARKELDNSSLRIAVMHHPLDWLAPEEKSNIQRYLAQNFDAYFCGHMHDNTAQSTKSNTGSLFTNNTGCLYQSLDYFNGYSVIDINANARKWLISAREYNFQRNSFAEAVRFSENGRWEIEFSTSLVGTGVLIPSEVTKAINERANSFLLSYSSSEIAPKSIGALFVEPPLSKMTEKELVAKCKGDTVPKDAYINLDSLSQGSKSIFFIGKKEAGKSLLLSHIAINCFQSFKRDSKLGLVIDLNSINKSTIASLHEQAVEFCGGEIPRRDLIKLLSTGEIVVCLDNVKTQDQTCVNLVRSFVKENPLCRYIFAGSEELLDELSGNILPDLGIDSEKIFVHSFRNRHTKELIKRWFGSHDLTINRKIQDINQLLNRLRIPRTPFLVSVLSWVLEQKPNATVINRASAIEILIEGLLEKFRESKSRKEVDSTIQQHFLTAFAFYLDESDIEWVRRLVFEEFVVSYFRKRGLDVSTEGFAHELIRKGLLYATEEIVGFKFDCFRAYFLARKFSDSPDLWKKALKSDNVAKYTNELDLFTGLHRDRGDILKASRDLCDSNFLALNLDISLDEIDNISEAALLGDHSLLNKFEKKLQIENGTNNDRHDEAPDHVSADHAVARKRQGYPAMDAVGKYIESLRIFSMILRNSELVDDLDLKRNSFESALEHWSKTLVSSIIASTLESEQIILDGKETEAKAEIIKRKQSTSLIRALIPQLIISLMCESLSTPKLGIFVKERCGDTRTLVRVLAIFLSFGSGAIEDHSIVASKKLIKDYKKNGFVMEMLFFRVLHAYINSDHESENSKKIRDLLGDVLVQLRGGSLQESSVMKSRFLGGLDKNILTKDFAENAS